MADWKCKAKKTFPLGPDQQWDGAEAKARLFGHFGFEAGTPDHAISECFLATDVAAPDLKGSYHDCFCDVVDGTIKAMPGALRACASRLPQTDIPDDVKADGEEVLAAYADKVSTSTQAESEVAMQAASMRTAGPLSIGAAPGNSPIPFTIHAVALDVPSPAPPIAADGVVMPVVLTSEVMQRDYPTIINCPVRAASALDSHGKNGKNAPAIGTIQHAGIEPGNKGGYDLVLRGFLWPNECGPEMMADIRANQGTLGSSLEWDGDYDHIGGHRVSTKFRGTGLAILAQKSAAWRDYTSLQMAASAAEITPEENEMAVQPAEADPNVAVQAADVLVPDPDETDPDVSEMATSSEMVENSASDEIPQDGTPSTDTAAPEDLPVEEPLKAAGATLDDLMGLLMQILECVAKPPHEEVEEELKDTLEEEALADAIEDLNEGEEMEEAAEPPEMPVQAEVMENVAEAACVTQAETDMPVPMKAEAGVLITPEELAEHDREVIARAAALAPNGEGVAHVNMQASEAPTQEPTKSVTLLDEGYRKAREQGLTGWAYTQFAFNYAQSGGAGIR